MRRGRSWRGGINARGGHYRGGGGAGYNPRGFLSSGPPRLNRPPWPHQIPSLFPQFGPGPPGPPGHFNEEGDGNYGQRTAQRSPQKFYPHAGFQRGNSQKFQRGGRTDYQHNHTQNFESTPDFTKAPPNFQPRQNFPSNHQQSKQTPHTATNFEQKPSDRERSPPDFPQGRPDFQKEKDFNKPQEDKQNLTNFQKRLVNRQSHDFDGDPQTFEQAPQPFERGSQNLPRGIPNFRDDNFNDEQQGGPNHITFQTCTQNFQNRPNFPFKSGPPEFNQRPPSRYSLDRREQVDHSKPPPPLPHNLYSQDYDYQRRERRESTDLEGSRHAARTPAHTLPHEHSGQRPPATDHYMDRGVAADDGFHKSIGDTVDIIKKRLLDRRDNTTQQQESNVDTDPKSWSESDSPDKRERSHRRRPRKESTHHSYRSRSEKKCHRMKKKIVRELFKMDREALHKLVDDPNSSAKFEYALNSLIKESRNSLNRQMRSAAEKSLYGSTSRPEQGSKEDTVYEDTFMAQMQGVLGPLDIVMLSDIKPMVMAEINKVLQLDEYGQTYSEEDEKYHKERSHRDSYDSEPKDRDYYDEVFEVPLDVNRDAPINLDENSEEGAYISDKEEKSLLPEPNKSRHRSRDSRSVEPMFSDEDTRSKFPGNVESISDDEYPFEELDKQYHVAVEYSMLDHADRSPIPESTPPVLDNLAHENQNETTKEQASAPSIINVPSDANLDLKHTDVHETILKIANNENDNMTSNPIKSEPEHLVKNESIEKEPVKSISEKEIIAEKATENTAPKNLVLGSKPAIRGIKKETVSSNESKDSAKVNVLKTPNKIQDIKMESGDKTSKTRKRETDDKVSHRKEKRKKSDESVKSETNKKVLNKNIIINVNDCASKNSETCETGAKSVFNLFFSKPSASELHDDSERTEAVNISYSDKYVKRKPSTDKIDKDNKKAENKKVSSTPTKTANKDNTHSASQSSKAENKVKLQPINMFEQTPRKPATHSVHRNAAIISPDIKTSGDSPAKTPAPIIVKRGNFKMFKKPITLVTNSTQTLLKVHTRCTQTKNLSAKKMVSTSCQTDFPVEKPKDVKKVKKVEVMERMKEIDLEIQQLLQEKLELYKNFDSVEPEEKNIQSLGMAIVNIDSNNPDESGMLDTFTKMSEEELQEIAIQGFPDTSLLETESTPSPKKKIKKSVPANRNVKEQKKKKNIPKVVLKLNKSSLSSPDGSESLDEYKVVKSPKKQKKVTFHDELVGQKEVLHRKSYKSGLSLLERIMNDDKEFDLLDDEEEIAPIEKVQIKKPVKVTVTTKKKGRQPKKKVTNDLKSTVRDCSIVLSRMVLDPRLLAQLTATTFENEVEVKDYSDTEETVQVEDLTLEDDELTMRDDEVPGFSGIQLQDDMLDVSEDIVIDGNCDMDKPTESFGRAATSECDVVDNGTSREDAASEAPIEGCKLYDYSVNGDLGTEMVAVYGHSDAVVAVECVNDNFLAASTDGSVYMYDGREGTLLATLRGSNFPLTCLTVVQDKYGTTVYTGSLDSRIRCFDLDTCIERGPECNVLSPIQSMDRAWDTIFVGTRTGFVLQFECKNNLLIPVSSLKFSEQAILALRALKEGPRKVLLIASRSDQVTIKDAQTGLLLRTLEGPKMTVYCLLFEEGKVFCGTSTNHIQVFDFTNGASVGTHNGGKGVVCLRAAGGLLLAGCYDGCVYVYRSGGCDPIAQLRGPSTMLLSLAVIHSKIVASYKDKSLFMWKIPVNILNEMVL